ncbi:MAG: diguanylate cyclase [Actinomycetota bacterium]|nr:diguanylate cyclase [Actinomycetota bacterium]
MTAHDVTALRASEERFRAAFHDGPTPIARLDGDGVVLETNPALGRLTTHEVLARLADRLEREVARPIACRGGKLVVGSSCGLAVGQPGQSIEDLVDAADRAMYQRKRTRPADDAPTVAAGPAPRRRPGPKPRSTDRVG